MSHHESLLVLCLGISGCPMKKPQNGLRCPVNWIASFRPDVCFGFKGND
jgi:hypothetical protein